jgi:hypothetical protein
MTNARTLTVCQEDLKSIGNTFFEENGYLAIISDLATVHIEEILLREILKCYGDYEIVEASEHVWENGVLDVKLTTNLPYKECEAVLLK